jgi:hypothetical protein
VNCGGIKGDLKEKIVPIIATKLECYMTSKSMDLMG